MTPKHLVISTVSLSKRMFVTKPSKKSIILGFGKFSVIILVELVLKILKNSIAGASVKVLKILKNSIAGASAKIMIRLIIFTVSLMKRVFVAKPSKKCVILEFGKTPGLPFEVILTPWILS